MLFIGINHETATDIFQRRSHITAAGVIVATASALQNQAVREQELSEALRAGKA